MSTNIMSQNLLLSAIEAVLCNLQDSALEAFPDTYGEWDDDVAKERITFYLAAILEDDQEFELHQQWFIECNEPECSPITIEQFASEVSKEDFIATASLLKDEQYLDEQYLDCINQALSYIGGE